MRALRGLTQHKATSPASIESDAYRIVKTIELEEGLLGDYERLLCWELPPDSLLVDGSQHTVMVNFHQFVFRRTFTAVYRHRNRYLVQLVI
jgi:hypothetical protein